MDTSPTAIAGTSTGAHVSYSLATFSLSCILSFKLTVFVGNINIGAAESQGQRANESDWEQVEGFLDRSIGAIAVEAGGSPDCFYHCLLWWERETNAERHTNHTVTSLRRLVADHLEQHHELITDTHLRHITNSRRRNGLTAFTDRHAYIAAVRTTLYAGEPEIAAACAVLGVRIIVHSGANIDVAK